VIECGCIPLKSREPSKSSLWVLGWGYQHVIARPASVFFTACSRCGCTGLRGEVCRLARAACGPCVCCTGVGPLLIYKSRITAAPSHAAVPWGAVVADLRRHCGHGRPDPACGASAACHFVHAPVPDPRHHPGRWCAGSGASCRAGSAGAPQPGGRSRSPGPTSCQPA